MAPRWLTLLSLRGRAVAGLQGARRSGRRARAAARTLGGGRQQLLAVKGGEGGVEGGLGPGLSRDELLPVGHLGRRNAP